MNILSFRSILVVLFVATCTYLHAQLPTPNKPTTLSKTPTWSITANKKQVAVGDEVTLTFTSIIEKDWYMYSNDFNVDGPIPAEFNFEKNNTYELVGKTKPVGSKKHYEEIWGGDVSIFTGKAVFTQTIKILSAEPVIKVNLYFQECNEISGVCMPPYEQLYEVKNVFTVVQKLKDGEKETPATQPTSITPTDTTNTTQITTDTTQKLIATTIATNNTKQETFIGFLLLAFLGGLVAVATPCVFPMLPMTAGFFSKKSETKTQAAIRASAFGLSIIGIYASLGLVFAFFGLGPDFGNWLSTHWLPNILFFIIFMVFAASFLGLFEITLPHGLVNKIDAKSSMSNFAGLFFMAFTLVLVSFSCTGPIVGSLLIEAVGGKFLKPLLGMASFGFGLALPFMLFAIFPSFLTGLPKSGGWLNSVKVVLGFIEVAFAFKFLSIADVVYHWG
jgi:thiol:disulfide interchange protein